jgi:hypothetical protein
MTNELQNQLLQKYPQFFSDIPILGRDLNFEDLFDDTKVNMPLIPMNFGIECGDGWYDLLDTLLFQIRNVIVNYNMSRKYRIKNKYLYEFYFFLFRRVPQRIKIFKIPVRLKFVKKLIDYIYEHSEKCNDKLYFHIDQIKEKFGGLRFYYSGGNKQIDGLVSLAESMSYMICETCGSTTDVGQTKGWISVQCKECIDKKENSFGWEKNKRYL